MSEQSVQRDDDIILHQDLVEEVISSSLEGPDFQAKVIAANGFYNNPEDLQMPLLDISGGEPPTQAEFNELVARVNLLQETLVNMGAWGSPV